MFQINMQMLTSIIQKNYNLTKKKFKNEDFSEQEQAFCFMICIDY